jgi:CheY-like chemotaxis protein
MKSNDFKVQTSSTDIYELVSSAWNVISSKMKQRNSRGWLYVSKNLSRYIVADSRKISQLLLNLLENSVNSTNEGEIRFYVDWCEDGADYQALFEPNAVYSKKNSETTDADSESDTPFSSISENNSRRVQETNEFSQYQSVESKYLKYKPSNCKVNMSTTRFYVFSDSSTDINQTLCKNSQINPTRTKINTGYLRCEVLDTGCGTSESTLDELFSAFTDQDNSATEKCGCTGTGIFTAKKLIQNLNGEIRLQTIKNVGSDVIICLKTCSEVAFKSNTDRQLSILESKRALIVDDDILNHQIMSKYLDKLNVTYEIAEDGEQAYQKFIQHEEGYYSFITMDIQMPHLDGISSARLIRQFENSHTTRKSSVPIIFISANGKESESKETMDEKDIIKATAFYRKPLRFVEFQDIVNSILKRKQK